jgi:hypothetical protein
MMAGPSKLGRRLYRNILLILFLAITGVDNFRVLLTDKRLHLSYGNSHSNVVNSKSLADTHNPSPDTTPTLSVPPTKPDNVNAVFFSLQKMTVLACLESLGDCKELYPFNATVFRRNDIFLHQVRDATAKESKSESSPIIFRIPGEWTVPSVVVLHNVYVTTMMGWIISADKSHLLQLRGCGGNVAEKAANLSFSEVPHVKEAVHLTALWSNQHYHNFVEQLPRLMSVVDILQDNPDLAIIGKGRLLRYYSLFGLNEKRNKLFSARNNVVFVETLFVPETIGCFAPSVALSKAFQSFLRAQLTSEQPSRKFQITVMQRRKDRTILNHDHVMIELKSQLNVTDVEIVEFREDALPPTQIEQMTIFSTSNIIIGPHGAGFSFLMAAPPSAGVVELIFPQRPKCYQVLSNQLGLVYTPLPVKILENDKDNGVVDVDELLPIVRQHMDRIRSEHTTNP